MYHCTEGQDTHCSDNLREVPVVKIEQNLCEIDQNSQREVPALLAAG